MQPLTPREQEILDTLFMKSELVGYNPILDTTEEERRIAAKYIVMCLSKLASMGVQTQIVVENAED